MIILSNENVADLLSMEQTIEVVGDAMVEVSEGRTTLPLRSIMAIGNGNNMGMMPGAMAKPSCYGIKLVSLFPQNPKSGYSSHQGAIVLFEADHGAAIAMMNADLITAMRTAAASGVATRALARKDASRLAIIGYGEQGEHHLAAMLAVRSIREIIIGGRNLQSAAAFAEAAQSRYSARYPDVSFSVAESVRQAVENVDIVCTVTAADTPIVQGSWIAPGTHLNVVGSSIPSKREIDTDLVARSSLFVDYRPSTMAQAGEVILAIEEGRITADHIQAEIGEVIGGKAKGRESDDEITLYRSLGVAAQDIACAHYVLEQAKSTGLGTRVEM